MTFGMNPWAAMAVTLGGPTTQWSTSRPPATAPRPAQEPGLATAVGTDVTEPAAFSLSSQTERNQPPRLASIFRQAEFSLVTDLESRPTESALRLVIGLEWKIVARLRYASAASCRLVVISTFCTSAPSTSEAPPDA